LEIVDTAPTAGPVMGAQDGGMLRPDEVAAMVRLHEMGWGAKRLAREFGCARNTVRRHLREGGAIAYRQPDRRSALDGLDAWLRDRFFRHDGNADVIRQELESEHGVVISLRHVERRVAVWRRELRAQSLATIRYETPPGRQLQIDFGEARVWIAGEICRAHLFVATLAFSRRLHVRDASRTASRLVFRHRGSIRAIRWRSERSAFGQRPRLGRSPCAQTREVRFNARFHAFARYWSFTPRACAPYRARTKGKDERGVGYVKRNAVAGRRFASWPAFEAHLAQWVREVADVRLHGTTGEAPIERFKREAGALKPLCGRAPFGQLRDLVRRVQSDCAIDLDTNSYSVPWRLIGETVQVVVCAGRVVVRHAGVVVADHALCQGRRERIVDRQHLIGVAGAAGPIRMPLPPKGTPDLLRPLAEYEAVVGGGW